MSRCWRKKSKTNQSGIGRVQSLAFPILSSIAMRIMVRMDLGQKLVTVISNKCFMEKHQANSIPSASDLLLRLTRIDSRLHPLFNFAFNPCR